ncbi:Para-nitrobenzyl esterase [compost metagenome]
MYRFDGTVPGHPLLNKAVHGAEIVYAFNNLSHVTRLGAEITPAMQKLAESMHAAWIAFAHRGDPATSELSWPEYNLEGRPTLIFDEEMRVTQDPDSEKRKRIVSILV